MWSMPANSHALHMYALISCLWTEDINLLQGQLLMPDSQIWTNYCSLTHD